MRFNDIKNDEHLWEFMTEPSEKFVNRMIQIEGSILVLGGSGKMGKELVGLIRQADKFNDINRNIFVASTFSNPSDLILLEKLGVKCLKGDLADDSFLNTLPVTPNLIYMMGFKFGSSNDHRKAFHLNSIVPYLIGLKYSNSRIIVFSSGNPYPHTSISKSGCIESDKLSPTGIYGWSIVARESAFRTTAMKNKAQKNCFYRLMYAQHLNYGVLIDLAQMVYNNETISLSMPAVNLISQRDANEIAISSLTECKNEGLTINVSGPVWSVKTIVEKQAEILNRTPKLLDNEADTALIASDKLSRSLFWEYRDQGEEMIEAAANWISKNGNTWGKPTNFGKVNHRY